VKLLKISKGIWVTVWGKMAPDRARVRRVPPNRVREKDAKLVR